VLPVPGPGGTPNPVGKGPAPTSFDVIVGFAEGSEFDRMGVESEDRESGAYRVVPKVADVPIVGSIISTSVELLSKRS
jgi:hypothetical protein